MLPPLLPLLTEPAPSHALLERRGARRIAPGGITPCLIRHDGAERATAAWVHNLSIQGVGLLTNRPFPAGAQVSVMLINTAHTCAMSAQAVVARSLRLVNGDYYLGCRFDQALRYDQITPFLM
jgi:hypothetical protein